MRHKRRKGHKKNRPVIFRNRRRPESRWISLEDVLLNIYELTYAWWYRVPRGSKLMWRGNRIRGHETKHY